MRIGYLSQRFPVISQTFVLNQMTGLVDRGHDVVPISIATPALDEPVHADVEEYEFDRRSIVLQQYSRWGRLVRSPAMMCRVLAVRPTVAVRALDASVYGDIARRGLLLEESYHLARAGLVRSLDCVVCHFGPTGAHATMLRDVGVLQAPIVTVFHAFDLTIAPARNPRMYDRLFGSGDLFLAISEHARELLIGLGCPEARIRVHHMGVDPTRFEYRPRMRDHGPVKLLSIGRMVEKKGHTRGLEAAAIAASTGLEFEYTIVGDGELRSEVEAAISELGLGTHVHLVGWQPQEVVAKLIRDSDILLMPSLTAANGDEEGVPVVLMEAMATGMPVLSTRHAGIPELVQDGVNGMLVPENDASALGKALIALAGSPETWKTLGERARTTIEQEYDINPLNDGLVGLLEGVVRR